MTWLQRYDLVQEPYEATDEWKRVRSIADDVEAILRDPTVVAAIEAVDKPGASSVHIQNTFLDRALALGFGDERKGLFKSFDAALRPDYFMSLDSTGILMEVERGKTTINNMDLLDFWKCHICEHANYLFLLVPNALRQNDQPAVRQEFNTVQRRLSYFFKPATYTSVRGLAPIVHGSG